MRILFVENDLTFADTVTATFLTDHDVVRSGGVFGALDLFRAQRFDVALVDYDLDDAPGDVFVRRVRQMSHDFPVVAISAHDDGNAALLAAGANVVCSKGHFRQIGAAINATMQRVPSESVHLAESAGKGEVLQEEVVGNS